MAGVSGSQSITHHTNLLTCLSGQLNNPDVSDLTLQVDNDTYHVHKLILASQSSVFQSMLTGANWIESKEKLIKLDEHPDCIYAFSHFLKYLYSGEVTLNCDYVCSLHMLADKYDIVALKEACLEFIVDVLDGVHGDPLKSSTKWLPHIEKYVPDLVEKCFEVIRTHFYALDRSDIDLADLTVEQMKTILDPKFGNEVVAEHEYNLFKLVLKWNTIKSGSTTPSPMDSEILEEILPLIRFANMKVKDLKSLLTKCSKSHIKDMLFEACQCQYEMLHMALSNKRIEEVKCSCVESDQICKHMNPRFYFGEPYGASKGLDIDDDVEKDDYYIIHQPLDTRTSNLKSYVGRVMSDKADEEYDDEWHLEYHSVFEEAKTDFEATVQEVFKIRPHERHLGRKFTFGITVVRGGKQVDRTYTIKVKGYVTKNDLGGMDEIIGYSPRRFKGEWLTEDSRHPEDYEYLCYCAIYLH